MVRIKNEAWESSSSLPTYPLRVKRKKKVQKTTKKKDQYNAKNTNTESEMLPSEEARCYEKIFSKVDIVETLL